MPFRPAVASQADSHNFDRMPEGDEKIAESLSWKKEIIYDGFTYKNNDLMKNAINDG